MKWTFFPIVLCLLFLGSCQVLYNPNMVNTPLMSDGNELQGGMYIGSSGYSMQVAWSPVYRLALMANGNTFSIIKDSLGEQKYRHVFGEVGLGTYTRVSKYWRMELFAGYGGGSTGELFSKGFYKRFFIQPAGGISSPFFDASFSPRVSIVTHYRSEENGVPREVNNQAVFLEPQLMMRAGVEQLKFSITGSFAIPMGETNLGGAYEKGLMGSFGIHLTFGKDFSRYGETRFRIPTHGE